MCDRVGLEVPGVRDLVELDEADLPALQVGTNPDAQQPTANEHEHGQEHDEQAGQLKVEQEGHEPDR